ncbi:MAG: tetratricopeptide repeat protein [Flavobacteriales bacterium]|nr:tetratricopeptide repeat protein [Flavobacteriales bacterium]
MLGSTRSSLILVAALGLFVTAQAQSGKAFFKEAEALRQAQQLSEAVEKYGLAIQVEPGMVKAYQARAEVYTLLDRTADAAADLRKVHELDPGDAGHAARAARAYLDLGRPQEALELCNKALATDPKSMEALQTKVRVCLALNDLDGAAAASDAALAQKGTTDTYYLHGLVRMAQRDYRTAETDLERVIEWNYLYEDAYVALAEVQLKLYEQYTGPTMQLRTLDKAVERTTTALELNPRSTAALFTRSKAFALQKEYAKAIDDISKVIANGRTDAEVYRQRARYYNGYGQQQNAVNDLNRVLQEQPKDVNALLLRAECKEANVDLEGAQRDLDLAAKALPEGIHAEGITAQDIQERRKRVADALFELNREEDPPVITLVEPSRTGEVVQVSNALRQVKVNGHVRDRNLLKAIRVNGTEADFARDEKDPEFFTSIPLGLAEERLTVEAEDVYGNIATVTLKVERTEGVAPELAVTSPDPGADRIITVAADREDLFIEGVAGDASIIRSVTVDGIVASYVPDTNRTEFSIKLVIAGKDRFTVRAEDRFGNASEVVVQIQRKAAPAPRPVEPAVVADRPADKPVERPADKPTGGTAVSSGTTWVVYIENSEYRSFPALQGQGGDAAKMQKAFAKYNVQRTITKKNLSKQQLERFFSTELRDLVRSNKVNTVLVWYAGHGRTVGGKSYWIPVDAKKDDIYTFYNYGPLKNLIQNYSESVSNTLVVSDAAGSEASFYDLTR